MVNAYTKQDFLDGKCTAEGFPIKGGAATPQASAPSPEPEAPAQPETQPEAPAEPETPTGDAPAEGGDAEQPKEGE